MLRRLTSLFGATLLLVSGIIVSATTQSAAQQPSTQVRQTLLKLVPDPLPAQATPQDAPAFYVPDTLYQYMDGGADVFLLYDFQTLMHQEFRAKEVDVTVDVFDMGAPENAFGMYAAERSPKYHFIAIGAEAYQNEGILNFLQGRYYVKLAGFGAEADAVLEKFAKALSGRIGEDLSLPPLLQLLPPANRMPHSEQFLLKDPLGHTFLGPAYLATYGSESVESTLLVSVAPSEAEAARRVELLAKHFRSTGRCDVAPELGDGAIRGSNSFEGKVIARAKGRYAVVIFNPTASTGELLKDVAERLK